MTLETHLGQLLARHHFTLAVAESCTGGLIGHRLTNVPGSSDYFLGGVIAYAYAVKEHVLGVPPEMLTRFGAVSEQTARAMAQGVRRVIGADIGVAVTGIAGPGGGLPNKPVGLVWIALSTSQFNRAERYVWASDREGNKALSAEAALQLVKEYLEAR